MHVMEQLASERTRDSRELAEQLRPGRRLATLRRARRQEHKAQQRLTQASHRSATMESLNY